MTDGVHPFAPGDLAELALQPAQAELQTLCADPAYGARLAASDRAWTFRAGGRVVACAGLIVQWPGRALGWALIGAMPPLAWVEAVRTLRAELDRAQADGLRRIEITVEADFEAGHHMARLIGFDFRAFLPAYCPAGRDYCLYDRVRR